MANVLIIDDDAAVCKVLAGTVKRFGHSATCCNELGPALERVRSRDYDAVFLDVRLPDGSGLDQLPEFVNSPSSPEVVIMTGFGDPDGAEAAINSGAWDYLEKPLSRSKIELTLKRISQYREYFQKARKRTVALDLDGIVGSGPEMKACYDALAQAANSRVNVLISGETGTGKELFARAIHHNSRRAKKNFVVVDCAALPDTLVESMLFGHEKGAFTGAERYQAGLISQADGGTLFLDEIGELPLLTQKAFLRVLQERRFRPIGGEGEIQSDFRLLVATNRNLDEMVNKGQFRNDLLYRLRSFPIRLPPLREHAADIRDLVVFHMTRLCDSYEIGPKGFSPEFLDMLCAYTWPGNVRELFNTMERILAETRHEDTLFPKHLPHHIRVHVTKGMVGKNTPPSPSKSLQDALSGHQTLPPYRKFREETLRMIEKEYVEQLILITKGNIKAACSLAGIGRTRLYELMNKHEISRFGWSDAK